MSDSRALLRGLVGRGLDALMRLPAGRSGYVLHRDLPARMPDGVVLLGDRYAPTTGPERRPVVLIRLPYGRAGAMGALFGSVLARHGHQVLIQSTRGTFGSGGIFRPFSTEHEDGLATLAWVREQPWCDGRVAMTGGSYFGHTQWAVAPYADPPLVSFSPHITSARITQPFYDGGVPGALNALGWSATIARQERGPVTVLTGGAVRAKVRRALGRLPLQAADVAANGAPEPFWRDFVEHAGPSDPFWDSTDHSAATSGPLPPASMVTGWWDLFLPGQLADVEAMQEAGADVRLLVGPWLHGAPGEFAAMFARDLEWHDHHLAGGPAPRGKPVRVALQRTGTWLEFDRWPPAECEPLSLVLRSDGTLGPDADGGPPSRFTYDPADPTPNLGGPLLQPPGGQVNNRSLEERPDVLVFTGSPLPEDLDLVGPVSARIHVRTSVPHADVFVRLCDVDDAGRSLNVVDGIRRVGPDDAADADGERAVDVELFATGYRVAAGHRLRVQVSGGAFPRFARNLGTGDPLATAVDLVPCRFEVLHDAAHASSVTVSRLPAGTGRA